MSKAMITVKNVYKTFYLGTVEVPVLKGINLVISQGEFVSIMGPSGSGKSTLLYLLGGLESVTSGTIEINSKNIVALNDDDQSKMRRREIGFVFQAYNLIPNLTAEENILMPLLLDGKKRKDLKKELNEILEIVGLTSHRNHTPKELSGGQQQRVAIARAVITSPDIIFADEPIGNLDSGTGTGILTLLQRINREKKTTIAIVGMLGMLNNIMAGFLERKRSLALYRCIGMSKKGISKMMLTEAVAVGVLGSLIGFISSVIMMNTIPLAVGMMWGNLTVKPAAAEIAVLCIGGLAVMSLVSALPLRSSGKISIMESMRYE